MVQVTSGCNYNLEQRNHHEARNNRAFLWHICTYLMHLRASRQPGASSSAPGGRFRCPPRSRRDTSLAECPLLLRVLGFLGFALLDCLVVRPCEIGRLWKF